MSRNAWFVPLLLATGVALAEDAPAAKASPGAEPQARKEQTPKEEPKTEEARKAEEAKRLSGMSILGNQEAPKALVIVPWKSSEIGDALGISTMLDDSRQPVDREVFMRALSYYEIAAQRPATAAQRSK